MAAPPPPLSVLDLAPVSTGSTAGQALRNSIELAQLAERLGYVRHWVHLDRVDRPHVDHEPSVVQRHPRDRVPAGPHGDLEVPIAPEAQGGGDVVRGPALRDQLRALVDHRVEQRAGLVVGSVACTDHGPAELAVQPVQSIGGDSAGHLTPPSLRSRITPELTAGRGAGEVPFVTFAVTSTVRAMAERLGFIGLGIMGTRMAANLARAGTDLVVWNRTAQTAQEWAREHGAEVAGSPAEVAERSDVVITMVVDGDQVESVLLGDSGAVEGAHDGLLCIDMSTIGPRAARRIDKRLAERGIEFMDAPVTGSSPKAEDGTLTIMAGGSSAAFDRGRPLFEVMGELVVHVGEVGQGQLVKVINNAVAAANTAVVAEALLAGKAAGADLDALVKVIGAGSGASAMLELKAGPMRAHDWSTLFKLEHMLKDLRLCIEEAEAVGVRMELIEDTAEILAEADQRGLGERDFAALLEVVEERSGARLDG